MRRPIDAPAKSLRGGGRRLDSCRPNYHFCRATAPARLARTDCSPPHVADRRNFFDRDLARLLHHRFARRLAVVRTRTSRIRNDSEFRDTHPKTFFNTTQFFERRHSIQREVARSLSTSLFGQFKRLSKQRGVVDFPYDTSVCFQTHAAHGARHVLVSVGRAFRVGRKNRAV